MKPYGNSLELVKGKTRHGLMEDRGINRITPVTNTTLEIECDNGDIYLVNFQRIEKSVFTK